MPVCLQKLNETAVYCHSHSTVHRMGAGTVHVCYACVLSPRTVFHIVEAQ